MAKIATDDRPATRPGDALEKGLRRVAVVGPLAPGLSSGGLAYEASPPVPVAPSALSCVAVAGERYPVKSLQEASDVFRATLVPRLFSDYLPVIRDASGHVLGHVAFDGKIYAGLTHEPGDKPLFDPYVAPADALCGLGVPADLAKSHPPGSLAVCPDQLALTGCHPGRRVYPRMPLRAPGEACATCAVSTCRSAPSVPPADAPSWHWRPSDPNARPGGVLCQ